MSARILLIDDEPNLLLALSAYLRESKYEVVAVSSGEKGLATLRDWHPDVIICDIMMPGMDGLDVRRALEKDPRHRDTPFIFLTAKGQLDDRLAGLRSGADDYLIKPFEPIELEARVESLLRRVARDHATAAQDVEVLKENILTTVTHELRSPVAVVRSTLELALEGAFGNDVEQERLFLSRALESTHSLQQLIEDLLLMAVLDSGDLELFLEPVSVAHLLRQVQAGVQRVEAADALVIHEPKPADLVVCADRRYLQTVVGHLVDNALKFSPMTPVEIWAETQDNWVAITVTDRGEGIAAEHLPHIFDRFYQGDMSSTRAHEGLGCGLYLVRALVEAHGGHVKVMSQVGEGSRFTVWLPRGLPEGLCRVADLQGEIDRLQNGFKGSYIE
jgi:signal transduction histidine kinase